jgi:hypothetical protein
MRSAIGPAASTAAGQIGGRLLAGRGLDAERAQPRGGVVDPALDRVVPLAQAIEVERGLPSIVADLGQPHLAQGGLLVVAKQ